MESADVRLTSVFVVISSIFAALSLSGCATTTRVETQKVYGEVRAVYKGDDIRVATRDGRTLDFRITAINEQNVEGKGVVVARSDISSMKKLTTVTVRTQELSAEPAVKTVSTLAVVLGVVALVAILAVL